MISIAYFICVHCNVCCCLQSRLRFLGSRPTFTNTGYVYIAAQLILLVDLAVLLDVFPFNKANVCHHYHRMLGNASCG